MQQRTERLFRALRAMYGTQKMSMMFDGQSADDVRSVWGRSIEPYSDATIRAALDSLRTSGGAFVPSLPEFVSLCRDHSRPEHRPAVALPAPSISADQARANLMQIKSMLQSTIKRVVEA